MSAEKDDQIYTICCTESAIGTKRTSRSGRAMSAFWGKDQVSQFPTSELFSQVDSWIIAGFKAGGAETNMGKRLLSTFLRADLPRPTMIAASRVESGPDAFAYTYLTEILRSLLPLMDVPA
jgi:hypothetical protein